MNRLLITDRYRWWKDLVKFLAHDGDLPMLAQWLLVGMLGLFVFAGAVNSFWRVEPKAPVHASSAVVSSPGSAIARESLGQSLGDASNEAVRVPSPLWTCWNDSLTAPKLWEFKSCTDITDVYIANALLAQGSEKISGPLFLYWVDNFLVDAYTAFFIVVAVWGFQRRTGLRTIWLRPWQLFLGFTILASLMGAVLDHMENFWAAAQFHDYDFRKQTLPYTREEIEAIGAVSVWKWRFFHVNFVLAGVWLYEGVREEANWKRLTTEFRPLTGRGKWRWLRKNRPDEARRLRRDVLDSDWTSAPAILHVPSGPGWVCHAALCAMFVHGQLTSSDFRRKYFSIAGVQRTVASNFLSEELPTTLKDVEEFLLFLARRGYLAPKGKRYEVVYAGRED